MEMNYDFNPSLTSRAEIAVSLALWYHEDVLNFSNSKTKPDIGYRQESKVIENVSQLCLPENIQLHLKATVQFIGQVLGEWVWSRGSILQDKKNLLKYLKWTSVGALDFNSTTALLRENVDMNVLTVFRMACIDRNFDLVRQVWPAVKSYSHLTQRNQDLRQDISFFNHVFEQEDFNMSSIFYDLGEHYMLYSYLTDSDNMVSVDLKVATFLTQLSLLRRPNMAKWMLFLNNMNTNEQVIFFKKCPYNTLQYFLNWPLLHFFLHIANMLLPVLTDNDFTGVITCICEKLLEFEYGCQTYKPIFVSFWNESPLSLKENYARNEIFLRFGKLFTTNQPTQILMLLCQPPYTPDIFVELFCSKAESTLHFLTEENVYKGFKWLCKFHVPSRFLVPNYEAIIDENSVTFCQQYYLS